jgi:hypothetical protein
MRSRASSFKWLYPLLSPRSSSNFLRLLPRLLVTSIRPFIFPAITYFRRQFLRKIWPIQLAFRFLISCRIFLCSLTLSNTSYNLNWLFFSFFISLYSFANTAYGSWQQLDHLQVTYLLTAACFTARHFLRSGTNSRRISFRSSPRITWSF